MTGRRWRQKQVEQPFFGVQLRLVGDIFKLLLADHVDGNFNQIANDRFHVPANVAHLRELGRFHFKKRRIGQLGQPARNFCFAHAGGADHDDIFGNDFFGEIGRQLLPPYAITQGDGDRPLGVLLADHVFIEF